MKRLSQHKRRHRPPLHDAYDVVVLGAGIGGLSAGIEAAKAGASVLVVEQHVIPGGCCSAFYRKGYFFDAAVHNIAGAGKYSSYGQMLKRLGIEIEWLTYPDNGTTQIPGDRLCIPAFLPELKAELIRRFPAEAKGITSYLRAFQRFYRYIWRGADKDLAALEQLEGLSMDDFLRDHIHDPRCRWWLMSALPYIAVPTKELAAIEGIITLGSYMLQGTFYPKGGTQTIANAYADRLEALGGTLALRTEVEGLHLEEGRIKAVQLSQDQSVEATQVIANISPHALLAMLPEDAPLHQLRQQLQRGTISLSSYLTYMGFSPGADLSALPWGFVYPEYPEDPDDWIFLSKPTTMDPSLAPEGHQILCAMKAHWGPFPQRHEAKRHKEEATAHQLSQLSRFAPDLEAQLDFIESGSPATIHRYTGNTEGAVYGWSATIPQSGSKRLPQSTGIPNLHLAGHWTTPGSGVPAVTMSGINAAALALG